MQTNHQSRIPALMWWSLVILLCFVLSLRPVRDPDIWFQLLAGRYALEHGSVPHHDFFLYTAQGLPQLFGGWGFGVLAELAVRLGGWTGLSLFNALLWAGTLFLGLMAAQRTAASHAPFARSIDINQMVALSVALLVVYPAFLFRSDMRAEVMLYLAWMAAALIFESCWPPARIRRALIAFPLICLALAWVHTTALLMLPLLASCALHRWLGRHEAAISRNEAIWWCISAIASVALPLLNPNGVPQVFMQISAWMDARASGVMDTESTFIHEYLPIWDKRSSYLWPSAITLALGTVLWFFTAGKRRLPDLIAIAPMLIMALQHRRGMGLWAMALMVPLAAGLIRAFYSYSQRKPMPRAMKALPVASALLLLVSVLPSPHWNTGMLRVIPIEKVSEQILHALPKGGNVYMDDLLAPQIPYLLGESYKVGFAGHMIYRHPEAIKHMTTMFLGTPGWEQELAKYDVKVVGVTSQRPTENTVPPLTLQLAWHPRWKLAGIYGMVLIFQKHEDSEILSPADRWQKTYSFLENALAWADVAQFYAPDPSKLKLIAALSQQKAMLLAAKDQPERMDWAAAERLTRR